MDTPNLKVIALKRATIWLHKVVKIYRRLYGGQPSPYSFSLAPLLGDVTAHGRVQDSPSRERLRTRPYGGVSLCPTIFNKSLSNLAVLLILRRSFQWCWRIFPNLSMSKLRKPWKGLKWKFIFTQTFAIYFCVGFSCSKDILSCCCPDYCVRKARVNSTSFSFIKLQPKVFKVWLWFQ